MEVYAHGQGCAWHWYQGIRLVWWIQRNTTYAFVHRVQQERANTYSKQKIACFQLKLFFALQMSHSTNPKYKSDHIRIVLCVRACHTFTRLLPSAQAVSCSAHAGSGVWGGGETQLGTVSIVITTEICAWEPKETRTNTQNKIKEELQRHEQMCLG